MSSKASRISALEKLRNRREQGRSALNDYEVKEDDKVYDEVDEATNLLIMRRRMEDDFIADDDGLGYAEHGGDDWEENRVYSSEEDENGGRSKGKKKASKDDGKTKRKRAAVGGNRDIAEMLKKKGGVAVVGPQKSRVEPVETNNQEDDLSFLDELDNETIRVHNEHLRKKTKTQSALDRAMSVPYPSMAPITGKFQNASVEDNLSTPVRSKSPVIAPSVQEHSPVHDQCDNDYQFDDGPAFSVDDYGLRDEPASMDQENEMPLAEVKVLTKEKSNKSHVRALKPIVKFEAEPGIVGADPSTPQPIQPEPAVMPSLRVQPTDSWFNRRVDLTVNQTAAETASPAVAPKTKEAIFNTDDTLLMFWIDAFEASGEVYLFGKVFNKQANLFVSCCVTVSGIERSLFFLPREYVIDLKSGHATDQAVDLTVMHEELESIMARNRIQEWAFKIVEKKYAFEVEGVPTEADWGEVNYGFNCQGLSHDLKGKTFSHVFGTNTSALETVIIQSHLMGPCWIEIKEASMSSMNASWAKSEVLVKFRTNDADRLASGDVSNIRVLKDDDLHSGLYPDFCKASPPLTVMSINLKSVMNYHKNINEIVMASCLVYDKVMVDGATPEESKNNVSVYTVVRQLENNMFPMGFVEKTENRSNRIEAVKSETALLNYLLMVIHRIDPDVLVGHNFIGYDLDVLLHRMKELKISNWSKLGRLRRSTFPKLQAGLAGMSESTFAEKQVASGRLLCDTYLAAKDTVKAKSYSLSNLSQVVLKTERIEVSFDDIPNYYNSDVDLMWLTQHCENDAYLAMRLVFETMFIPLTKQLTNLAGNLWSRTMTGARAERNEFLLLHEFSKHNYVVPDRSYPKSTSKPSGKGKKKITAVNENADDGEDEDVEVKKTGRRKPAYAGGLVLEPKKGLYDKYVLMLDFNSLYPSIIQEYNICFTTVEREMSDDGDLEIPELPAGGQEQGVLPRLLANLVQRRRAVKGLMKDIHHASPEYAQLNIRQQALKLTANSMYGCLGFSHSRFYAKPLAMLITSRGREILQDTVNLAEQTLNLNVIYGDTDSIMIYTGSTDLAEVKALGLKLKSAVNKKYKLLEIEMDGFFRRMLLLKKKKYAALTASEDSGGVVTLTRETKGLDIVRRDWCGLSHDVSDYVIDQILSDADAEDVVNNIHEFLKQISTQTREGKIELDKFVINKALTKAPEEYNDAKVQPHVQVAIRMKAKGISVRPGETVPFAICVDSDPNKAVAQRAYHPDDIMRPDSGLVVDFEYYLNNQIHPPIARLCSPIEGTDGVRLAECLGLDTAKYRSHSVSQDAYEGNSIKSLESQLPDSERFKFADKLVFTCTCSTKNTFGGPARLDGSEWRNGFECSKCLQIVNVNYLGNVLLKEIRSHIKMYYEYWMTCDEPSCGNRARQVSVLSHLCIRPNCYGQMHAEYSDSALFTQLMYYCSLFDRVRFLKKNASSQDKVTAESICHVNAERLDYLLSLVLSYTANCARGFVDFNKLFATLSIAKNQKAKKEIVAR